MSQADALPDSADSVSTASAELGGSSPDSSSDAAPQDTRAIAASVFADSGDGQAAPPPADVPADSPPPAAAISDEFDENDPEYQKLLASGYMPVPRHKAVITNTRNKTRQQTEQEVRAEFAWLKADRGRVENALGLMDTLSGPQKEHAFRTLAHALGVDLTPPAAKEPEGPPPADVKLEDGSEFFTAATTQKREQWLMGEFDKKIAALEQRYQPLIHERHMSALRAEAQTEAGTTLAECRAQWPSFQPLEKDIKQLMTANPTLSLERAYIQAFAAKGLPAIQQQHATDRASQLTRKAAASSAPPGAARPVVPLRDRERSTRDIAREELTRSA